MLKTLLHAPGTLRARGSARGTVRVRVRVRVSVSPNPNPDPDLNPDPNPGTVNSTALDCALQYAGSTSPVLSGSLGVPTFPEP